jgi:hypothetical protein
MEAVVPMMVVGSLVSAGGTIAGGKAQESYGRAQEGAADYAAQTADNTAMILEKNAGQERAASQRAAAEDRRRARLAGSRALAVAASSGGGASDINVTDAIADLAGEGEYRALTSLYSGEQSARNLEAAAYDKRNEAIGKRYEGDLYAWEGRQARKASNVRAISTLIGGATGIAGKYK